MPHRDSKFFVAIKNLKDRAGAYANREVTLMYWEVGRYIGSVLLGNERAEYGNRIVTTLTLTLLLYRNQL